ncbi:unnamed protein product [Gulo gulo]|uniref:Uncharacterized protein n=1 Tax=Gulo gulo TaxID=48420 RepID=A0A9X9Q736_GULGU|nr:unnamed protein product [Gulo gulo]
MRQSTAANSRRSGLEGGLRKVSAASEGGTPTKRKWGGVCCCGSRPGPRVKDREPESGDALKCL